MRDVDSLVLRSPTTEKVVFQLFIKMAENLLIPKTVAWIEKQIILSVEFSGPSF